MPPPLLGIHLGIKILQNPPDVIRFEAAAAPNVPGKKLKVTILKPWYNYDG